MSRVHEYEEFGDDENPIELEGEEAEEVEAALKYADEHPDERSDAFEFLRKLREGS